MNVPPCSRPNSHTPASVVPVTYFRNMPTSRPTQVNASRKATAANRRPIGAIGALGGAVASGPARSEEHTSELQSRGHLVCRLLLEKKKYRKDNVGMSNETRCR